jgi:hypothetical protein
MGHTPYGYSIENGCATIKEDEANKIRKLYENYLSGMALAKAAAAAGIETYHGTAKRLMENRHYLGDDFYPAIIDQETYDKAAAIRLERAGKLGRLNRKRVWSLRLLLPAFAWQWQSNIMKIRGCRPGLFHEDQTE